MQLRSQLREMYEEAPSLVAMTVGPDHRLVYANAALRKALGPIEFLERPVEDILPIDEERREIRSYLNSVFRSGAQLVRHAVPMAVRTAVEATLVPAFFDAIYVPLLENGEIVGVFVEGHDVTDRVVAESAKSPIVSSPTAPELTERQRQVLAALMAGYGNKQIAHKLSISPRTAEMHRRSLLRRLGVRSTAQLIKVIAERPDLARLAHFDGGSSKSVGTAVFVKPIAEAEAEAAGNLKNDMLGAHARLRDCMWVLDTLTQSGGPDRTDFLESRWAISQASLARRSAAQAAHNFLVRVLDESSRATVQRVAFNEANLLKLSAAHTSRWTTSHALENWPEYRSASREIRRHMSAQMDLEKEVILPLLEEIANKGPSLTQSVFSRSPNGNA